MNMVYFHTKTELKIKQSKKKNNENESLKYIFMVAGRILKNDLLITIKREVVFLLSNIKRDNTLEILALLPINIRFGFCERPLRWRS